MMNNPKEYAKSNFVFIFQYFLPQCVQISTFLNLLSFFLEIFIAFLLGSKDKAS